MKAMVCELCGSNDIVKQDGYFVCQHCGTKYSLEEAKRILVEVDNSKQTDNLYKLARRELQMNDYVKAKEYYDQILVEKPDDWEASFFSILGKAYGITKGQVPSAVSELVNNIPIAIKVAVESTDDLIKRREYLDTIVTHTVKTYTYLKANLVSTSVRQIIDFWKLVVNCVSEMGYQIQEIGKEGKLGEESEYNKLVAKALRWRTEYVLERPGIFDVETRTRYAEELETVDPTYRKPEIKSKPGGCYIATAVYGSYDCPEVWTLRRYRDYTLAETWYGRAFIHTYYAISPTLVKWFGNTEWFRKMCKPTLDRMVAKLNRKGVAGSPYKDRNW